MDFNIDPYKKMVPETMYEEHLDLYTLFTCIKLKYIRNSYRWNSSFKNKKWTMTNFDYAYANKNKCFENFKLLQSNFYKFRKIYRLKQWTPEYETKFISFIYTSMEQLVNNLSVPIRDNSQVIENLVSKYKNIFDEEDEEYEEESEEPEEPEEPPNKKNKN
jgi:hypothetical protein